MRTRLTLAAVCCLGVAGLWWSQAPSGPVPPSPDQVAAEQLAQVASSLQTYRELHGPVGKLTQEATEALIAQREATATALAQQVAELEDPSSVLEQLRSAERVRDQLVLIEGLGNNPSVEAVQAVIQYFLGIGGCKQWNAG